MFLSSPTKLPARLNCFIPNEIAGQIVEHALQSNSPQAGCKMQDIVIFFSLSFEIQNVQLWKILVLTPGFYWDTPNLPLDPRLPPWRFLLSLPRPRFYLPPFLHAVYKPDLSVSSIPFTQSRTVLILHDISLGFWSPLTLPGHKSASVTLQKRQSQIC